MSHYWNIKANEILRAHNKQVEAFLEKFIDSGTPLADISLRHDPLSTTILIRGQPKLKIELILKGAENAS
jgi:hypothetical protein